MDVALAIFNVGAGLGVLAAGGALVYLAWQTTPLIRESRALTADLRRLTRTADQELRPILTHARELTSNVEVLSEDVAVKLERLSDLMNSLQRSLDTIQISTVPRRVEALSVESWETREDSSEP
jgi:mevalonate kinase